MSDLHIVAQEIMEDLNDNCTKSIAGIINYHTQNNSEAEKVLIIEALSEMLKEQLMGTH